MAANDVELHAAWMWDCPECGAEHFCRSVRLDISREEAIKLAIEHGLLEPWEEVPADIGAAWLTTPDDVACSCGGEFSTYTQYDGG